MTIFSVCMWSCDSGRISVPRLHLLSSGLFLAWNYSSVNICNPCKWFIFWKLSGLYLFGKNLHIYKQKKSKEHDQLWSISSWSCTVHKFFEYCEYQILVQLPSTCFEDQNKENVICWIMYLCYAELYTYAYFYYVELTYVWILG